MLMTVMKVLYVVIAILMVAFILLQRGAGAQQGGGFGAGASATVFGSSGSANFLSRTTKWLAALFFGLSIGMAAMISHGAREQAVPTTSRMSTFSETPAAPGVSAIDPVTGEATGAPATTETPAVPATTPATSGEAPAAPAEVVPAAATGEASAAPATTPAPAAATPAPAAEAATTPATEAPAAADKPEQKGDN